MDNGNQPVVPKQTDVTLIFGFLIALVLLTLYVGTLSVLIWDVVDSPGDIDMSSGATFVLTTVGGLISALVIAVLAVTKPGQNPGARFGAKQAAWLQNSINVVVLTYLSVWLICGLAALIFGVMIYPGGSETLNDIGTNWLGVAVAAAYAYFGIKP